MKRILVADDTEQLRTSIVQFLRALDYQCDEACDGKVAQRLLNTEHYDLLITDLIMPEQEGIETIIKLRRVNKDLKIIAMSGNSFLSANALRQAKFLGADTVLHKPFEFPELQAEVEKLLAEKATL